MHKHTQGCTQNQYIQDTTWAHTRPAHTLSSRQRYTSKLSVVENVDHTCQRNTVLSRVRLPSSPQSPPHSNILKAQSCQYNPTQSTKSPGKSPRVPALALPDQKGRGGERRSSATGALLTSPLLGQPCRDPLSSSEAYPTAMLCHQPPNTDLGPT